MQVNGANDKGNPLKNGEICRMIGSTKKRKISSKCKRESILRNKLFSIIIDGKKVDFLKLLRKHNFLWSLQA